MHSGKVWNSPVSDLRTQFVSSELGFCESKPRLFELRIQFVKGFKLRVNGRKKQVLEK